MLPDTQTAFTLLVAENAEKKHSIANQLRFYGMTVLESASADETLRLSALHPGISIALVNADLDGMTEFDMIRELKLKHPELKIVLLSSYLNLASIRLATMIGCSEVLQTPISSEGLNVLLNHYIPSLKTASI